MNILDLNKVLNLPYLASEHGAEVDKLIIFVHFLMAALFVGWIIYFGYVLLRFREKRNPKADHLGLRSNISTWIELVVVGAEVALLVLLAVPLWAKVVTNPPTEGSTQVRVIAQQFGWNIRYPGPDGKFGAQDQKFVSSTNQFGMDYSDVATKDDISILGKMVVPVNKPVVTYITSMDVIHSFKVLQFRTTQDAIPGLSISTWFTPTVIGRYTINCAQLCGGGHSTMKGNLDVVSEEDFAKFIEESSSSGAATPLE